MPLSFTDSIIHMVTPDTDLGVTPESSCAPQSPHPTSHQFLLDVSQAHPSSPSQTNKTQIQDFFLFGSAASIVAPLIHAFLQQLLCRVFLNSNPIMSFPLMAPLSASRHIPCSLSCPCNTRSPRSHLLPFLVPQINAPGTPTCLRLPKHPWIFLAFILCIMQPPAG